MIAAFLGTTEDGFDYLSLGFCLFLVAAFVGLARQLWRACRAGRIFFSLPEKAASEDYCVNRKLHPAQFWFCFALYSAGMLLIAFLATAAAFGLFRKL